jgi:hypothetical protein
LPFWIEQLGLVAEAEVIWYITPFGALRWIAPPAVCPSITLAVQLEKLASKVATICLAPIP